MALSKDAHRLRERIEQAIEDCKLTREELDDIMHIALEDGHIDPQEQALLDELHNMIQHKEVKVIP